MGLAVVALIAIVFLVVSSGPPKETVVLLPDKNGKVGTVIVHANKGETVLNSAYATSRTTSGGGVQQEKASEGEVKQIFGNALAAMPQRPISFTLYFVSGSDEFTEETKQEVQKIFAEMARRAAPDIVVIGHTDMVGSDQSNDALSLQRADRVKEILVGLGIPAQRIVTAGRGKREPLVPTAEGIDEPRNRRVEISVR